jgi:cytochrome c oxidase assembly protein subunit 11
MTTHRRTVLPLLAVIFGMLAVTAYSPTLYRIFCEVTGVGGATGRSAAAPAQAVDRTIAIEFAGEVQPDLAWRFGPAERRIAIKVGEQRQTRYIAENVSSQDTTGTAVFNVAPAKAGKYFKKIACFCFEEQHLRAGQRVEMPVVFFVDPEIVSDRGMDDVSTITLHYTFYRAPTGAAPDKASAPGGSERTRAKE